MVLLGALVKSKGDEVDVTGAGTGVDSRLTGLRPIKTDASYRGWEGETEELVHVGGTRVAEGELAKQGGDEKDS